MKSWIAVWLLISGCIVCSCAPNSQEDFVSDGNVKIKKYAQLLSKVETKEDLIKSASKLKKLTEQMVDLMIDAKEFENTHMVEEQKLFISSQYSDLLQKEMERVYQIEGAQQIIETMQRNALHRLDAYEQKRQL